MTIPKTYQSIYRALTTCMVAFFAMGCASTEVIPVTIQSDPLGGVVLMKMRDKQSTETDWIYLGNTPLTTQREFNGEQLKNSETMVLRIIKEGYHDQAKEWSVKEVEELYDDHGQIYWNPRLVKSE